jgi:hypothetical protein
MIGEKEKPFSLGTERAITNNASKYYRLLRIQDNNLEFSPPSKNIPMVAPHECANSTEGNRLRVKYVTRDRNLLYI